MFAAAIIVFREVLEAALIIGIVAASTRNLPGRNYWLGVGMAAGLGGSVLVAGFAGAIAELAEGMGQELFNASILGAAALMLAWHSLWMASHGAQMARNARHLGQALTEGRRQMSALALVVGLALLREGSETVLFLYGLASGGQEPGSQILGGALLGVVAGVASGYALYAGVLRIPARHFFSITSGFILLLTAGLASQAARFLVQADWLPSLADPLWNTSGVLDETSMAGRVLHTLVGYEARPSGMQVVFYVATLALLWTGQHTLGRPGKATPAAQARS